MNKRLPFFPFFHSRNNNYSSWSITGRAGRFQDHSKSKKAKSKRRRRCSLQPSPPLPAPLYGRRLFEERALAIDRSNRENNRQTVFGSGPPSTFPLSRYLGAIGLRQICELPIAKRRISFRHALIVLSSNDFVSPAAKRVLESFPTKFSFSDESKRDFSFSVFG